MEVKSQGWFIVKLNSEGWISREVKVSEGCPVRIWELTGSNSESVIWKFCAFSCVHVIMQNEARCDQMSSIRDIYILEYVSLHGV